MLEGSRCSPAELDFELWPERGQVDLAPETPPSDRTRACSSGRRALGQPQFDQGEREYGWRSRAGLRRSWIRAEHTLVERVEALRAVMAGPQILLPGHIQYLLEWRRRTSTASSARSRATIGSWARRKPRRCLRGASSARASPAMTPTQNGAFALVLGSLFAFTIMFGALPMLRPVRRRAGGARSLSSASGRLDSEQFRAAGASPGAACTRHSSAPHPVRDLSTRGSDAESSGRTADSGSPTTTGQTPSEPRIIWCMRDLPRRGPVSGRAVSRFHRLDRVRALLPYENGSKEQPSRLLAPTSTRASWCTS